MREAAQALHTTEGIRWLDDRLPTLFATHRLGLAFDLILLSGVLIHVPTVERPRAFRKVATLLKPGGLLLMSMRDGAGTPAARVARIAGRDRKLCSCPWPRNPEGHRRTRPAEPT